MERLSIEERVEGFRRFFAMDNRDGPLVGFFWGTYYPWKRYRAAAAIPGGPFGPDSLDPTAFVPDYQRLHEQYEQGGGDFIWSGSAFWGVPWMEALCGCPVVADHDTGSARSHPPDAVRPPESAAGSPWGQKAAEFLRVLNASAAGQYPMGTTLMRGLSDVLAALYGSPDFVFNLADHPDEADRVLEQIADLWIQFARVQLDAIPDFHGGV
ncbi:unnamed protein product, partial [marine sediment metagenome]